jgi:hypothetical protein
MGLGTYPSESDASVIRVVKVSESAGGAKKKKKNGLDCKGDPDQTYDDVMGCHYLPPSHIIPTIFPDQKKGRKKS